jgi:hexosaminidase
MPGHSLAAMFSYPELCCFPNDIKEFKEGQVTTDIYCAGKEESFVFLENVLKEVFALFPSKYIHIGGDEAFKDKWKKCLRCQKRIQDEGLKNEDELQSWFIRRMEKFINANGKSLIGWDEILDGGLAPNATVMAWRGERGAVEAAKLGNDAVNATAWPLYFSDGQNSDERAPGNPGGNSLMKVYEYNPMPNGLTEKEQKHILGAQGCLWSEFTPRFEHIEHQLFPRICALSEIIWSKPDKDWWGFYNRVAQHENLLRQYKINYSQRRSYIVESKREINPKKKGIYLALTKEVKEPIYYTLDGTTPTKDSKVYQKPLFLNQTTTIKACIFDQAGKTDRVNTNFYRSHQAIALKVNCGEAFKDVNVTALTDGQLETSIQFEAKDLDFTIDLGKVKLVKSLSTTFKEVTFKRFFLPETASFMVSADGVNYETVATYASPTLPENRKIFNSKGEMAGKVGKPIRYVRLLAKNPGLVQGKSTITGQLTKVLLDEIVVD